MFDYPEYSPEDVYRDIQSIVPEEHISQSVFEKVNNAIDPYTYNMSQTGLPYIVVRPGSTEEVSGLMKHANSRKIPAFYPTD